MLVAAAAVAVAAAAALGPVAMPAALVRAVAAALLELGEQSAPEEFLAGSASGPPGAALKPVAPAARALAAEPLAWLWRRSLAAA